MLVKNASVNLQEFSPTQYEIDFARLAKIATMVGRPRQEPDNPTIRLQEVMDLLGLKDKDVAKKMGVKVQTVQRWRAGDRGLKVHELERLAQKLGVPAQRLLLSVDPVTDQQEAEMLAIMRGMSPERREMLLHMARSMTNMPPTASA